MIEWFGPVVREAYGGSESGIISYITSDDWLSHPGSVGQVQAPFRALVLDEDGSPCPPGQNGQLYFEDATGRGIRYHNDPEKTEAAHLRPGVFTLGDMGHVDADGFLYITGRVIDMVISGGVNIYPAECERILSSHPAVKDVAVFGRPDDEMGERLVGLVSTLDGDTTAREPDLVLPPSDRRLQSAQAARAGPGDSSVRYGKDRQGGGPGSLRSSDADPVTAE